MLNPISFAFRWIGDRLADRNIIERARGERIADLAWPRFLTMFARQLYRVADLSMIGLTIGSTGVAGLAFATVYWDLANGLLLGLAGGTVGQVSQRFGAERHDQIDLAVKQGLWVGAVLIIPFVLIYGLFADPLIALFTDSVAVQRHGTAYLSVISVALIFAVFNLVSSRTLAGADDTRIAMTIRATGAFVNIVFNAIFIFGLGMGAAGAALGTVLAESLVAVAFMVGFVHGRLPIVGQFPVEITPTQPYFDLGLSMQLLSMARPIMIQRFGRSLVRFPLFAILATFGPAIVAAFEAARRIRQLLGAFGAGFSISASSLVGQELGRNDEPEAERYSWDVLRFSGVVYASATLLVFAFAPQIARLFAEDPVVVSRTVPFVRVAAISFLGYGLNRTFQGILKAAGDNKWSMYGRLFGLYVALLPLVYLGSITPIGIFGVYLAIIAEMWSSMAITAYRFVSGAWIEVSRTYRPDVAD